MRTTRARTSQPALGRQRWLAAGLAIAQVVILAPVAARAGSVAPAPALAAAPAAAAGQVAAAGRIAAAGRVAAAEPGYRWPLPGPPAVVRGFDPPAQRWLPGHRGVDLAAPPGTTVVAAGGGVVFFAGPVAGRPVVSIAHPDGLRTTYEPVDPVVSTGDLVAAGDPIGVLLAGHPGCPADGCLHWGLRQGQSYLDPLSLLGLGRVRLLPRGS